eukprot:3280031-Rhodomonas_salina.2
MPGTEMCGAALRFDSAANFQSTRTDCGHGRPRALYRCAMPGSDRGRAARDASEPERRDIKQLCVSPPG